MSFTFDVMKPRDGSESPASSTGAPPGSRQKTVPISRNQGSGYERPERARTSHACEPCRERKTKCDGERPSCRRCLHTGTGCHYGYGKGWKKRKTAEDLTVTSKKLSRYENLLNDILPMVSSEVRAMIEDARQQEASPPMHSELTDSGTPMSNHALDGDTRIPSPTISRLPMPLGTSTSQATLFAQTPRSLPPPMSLDLSTTSLPPHVGHQSLRISPTEDGKNGSSFRLPSITRQGVLFEGAQPEQRPQFLPSSASEPLVKLDHNCPSAGSKGLADAQSPQGGLSKSLSLG